MDGRHTCNQCGFSIQRHQWTRHRQHRKGMLPTASEGGAGCRSPHASEEGGVGSPDLLLPITRWREDLFVTDTAVRQIKSDVQGWIANAVQEASTSISSRLDVDRAKLEQSLHCLFDPFRGQRQHGRRQCVRIASCNRLSRVCANWDVPLCRC